MLLAGVFLVALSLFVVFEGGVLLVWQREQMVNKNVLSSNTLSFSPSTAFLYSDFSDEESIHLGSSIVAADARPLLIKKYLEFYNSPLVPYADLLFSVSQKYGMDYRLLVAIAQQESNLCKKIPENSYNCWGWGIHSRGTLRFSSYPEAVEAVAKGLRESYIGEDLNTPEEIMAKYTPLSNGSWAAGVRQFMEEIEEGLER